MNHPNDCAEDGTGFLESALVEAYHGGRRTLVSHANHGKLTYCHGPWLLVSRNQWTTLDESRGWPNVSEVYNLATDEFEAHDLAEARSENVMGTAEGLRRDDCLRRGRAGISLANGAYVDYGTTQSIRWPPIAEWLLRLSGKVISSDPRQGRSNAYS